MANLEVKSDGINLLRSCISTYIQGRPGRRNNCLRRDIATRLWVNNLDETKNPHTEKEGRRK